MNKKFIALTVLALGIYSTGYGAQTTTPKAPPAKGVATKTLKVNGQNTNPFDGTKTTSLTSRPSYADQARAGLKRAGLALESFASGVQQSAKDFYNNPKQSVTKAASATGVALRDTASAVYNAPGQLSARLGGQKDFITGTQGSLRSAVASTGDAFKNKFINPKDAQQETILYSDGGYQVNRKVNPNDELYNEINFGNVEDHNLKVQKNLEAQKNAKLFRELPEYIEKSQPVKASQPIQAVPTQLTSNSKRITNKANLLGDETSPDDLDSFLVNSQTKKLNDYNTNLLNQPLDIQTLNAYKPGTMVQKKPSVPQTQSWSNVDANETFSSSSTNKGFDQFDNAPAVSPSNPLSGNRKTAQERFSAFDSLNTSENTSIPGTLAEYQQQQQNNAATTIQRAIRAGNNANAKAFKELPKYIENKQPVKAVSIEQFQNVETSNNAAPAA